LFYKDSSNVVQKIGYKLTPTTAGGTGLTSFTANGVVYASSTSALATGSALVFDGTNVGVGVTPTGWNGLTAIQVGQAASLFAQSGADYIGGYVGSNIYYNAGWKYIRNGYATKYSFNETNNGQHQWWIAPNNTSGAGAAATETQAMTLDASGNLGIGTTSPSSILHISKGATSGAQLNITRSTATATVGVDNGNSIIVGAAAGDLSIRSSNANILFADSSGTESMRLASGNLGVGTTSPSQRLHLNIGSATAIYSRIQNSAGDCYLGLDTSGNTNLSADNAGNQLIFKTQATECARIDSSGNLGVGTTSPSTGKFGDASCAVLVQSSDPAYGTNIFSSNSNNTKFVGFWSGHSSASSAVGVKSGTALTFGAWGAINGAGGFSEWGRFDSSGNLLVGTTGLVYNGKVSVSFASSGQQGIALIDTTSATGGIYAYFINNSGNVAGSISRSGTTTVLYNVTSDERAKKNIQDADSASSLIDSLKVRQFDWKEDDVHQRYGFIAQEIVTVVPEAVHQPQDTEQMMAVDYSKLVPMLVKEIQSLRKRLAALESN
jgi:hypothetical protein